MSVTIFFVNNKPNKFSIFHQNIQGLLSKRELIEITLSQNNFASPDILCFTETFVKNGDERHIFIKNYTLAAYHSREYKRGGTSILIKNGLSFQGMVFNDIPAIDSIFEYCAISITKCNMIIICIYRIPTQKKSNIDKFFDKFELLLHRLTLEKNPKNRIIITGDLNINILQKDYKSDRLTEILNIYQLKSHINEPTRGKSCIDLIISNIEDVSGYAIPLWLSDHDTAQLVSFPINNKQIIPKKIHLYKRCYYDEYINKFKYYLSQVTFSDIFSNSKPNLAFNDFYETFITFYKSCFPLRKITIKQSERQAKWITKGIKKAVKIKEPIDINITKVNQK